MRENSRLTYSEIHIKTLLRYKTWHIVFQKIMKQNNIGSPSAISAMLIKFCQGSCQVYCGPWRGGERWWRPRYKLLSVGHLHVRHSGNDANNNLILYPLLDIEHLKTDRQRFSFFRTNCGRIWRVVLWPLLALMEKVRWL